MRRVAIRILAALLLALLGSTSTNAFAAEPRPSDPTRTGLYGQFLEKGPVAEKRVDRPGVAARATDSASLSLRVTNPAPDETFIGTATNLTFRNSSGDFTVSCASGTLGGTVPNAIGKNVIGGWHHWVGRITDSTITGCHGPNGDAYTVTFSLLADPNLYPESHDPATGKTVMEDDWHSVQLSGPGCMVYADLKFTYTNATRSFSIESGKANGYDCSTYFDSPDTLLANASYLLNSNVQMVAATPVFTASGAPSSGVFTSGSTGGFWFDGPTGGFSGTCTSVEQSGTVASGAVSAGGTLFSITGLTVGGCEQGMSVEPIGLPWDLRPYRYESTGYTYGEYDGMAWQVTLPDCSFKLEVDSNYLPQEWVFAYLESYGPFLAPAFSVIVMHPTDLVGAGCADRGIYTGARINISAASTIAPDSLRITVQ
ncbi:Uncharacterised protein [Mycobacterium tuberculosis]|nr:Uncharacterised protein [Mycobacterium tuberculosis]